MANMKKPLCSVLNEILSDLRSDPDISERIYGAALFLAAVCHFNAKRNRGSISYDEVQKGFEDYRLTVSGPCYELFSRILRNKSDIPKFRVSSNNVKELADKIYNEHFKESDEEKFRYFDALRHVNYDALRKLIEQKGIKARYKKAVIPGELIISCFDDLINRVPKYNKTQNKSGTKKYHNERAQGFFSENEEKAARNNAVPETRIAFALASYNCRSAIEVLNQEYKNKKTDDETRKKLEKILIPVFSNSPYFSLCIAHKNMLPEELIKKGNRKQIFVFVIQVISYDILKTQGKELYIRSQNIVSQSLINSLKKPEEYNPNAKITEDNVDEYYCRKKRKQGRKEKYKYILAADDYDFMLSNYKRFCHRWKYVLVNNAAPNSWFPLELPGKTCDRLSFLFEGSEDYSLKNLLKEQEEMAIESTSRSAAAVSRFERNRLPVRDVAQDIKEIDSDKFDH